MNWKGNFVLLGVLAPSWGLALVYHLRTETVAQETRLAQFQAKSQIRHARLLGELAIRQRSLDSLAALFRASARVTEQDFDDFCTTLRSAEPGVELSWHASDGTERFSSGAAGAALEILFDPLEPSRVYGDPARVILSQPVKAKAGQQRGFVSIAFGLGSLALEDPGPDLLEYLILSDAGQNVASAYRAEHGIYTEADPTRAGQNPDALYFEVARVGSVGFFYLAAPAPHDALSGSRLATLAALLGLGLLSSLYVRGLVVRQDQITEEVRVRTDELTQFAYRTSHDLRAPLITVGGLCRAAREDLDGGDSQELRANLERIESQVGRLDVLVQDILKMARADLMDQELERVDLGQLVREVVEGMRHTFPRHRVRTVVQVDRMLSDLLLPRPRIAQILENLVSNAIKYANIRREESYVTVAISMPRELEISVRDNGLGIPKEMHGRLFQMFQRFHPQVSDVGSGLGMSIVKKHVDRLGGSIDIESSGEGTEVTIRLPGACAE
ncbi:MAG: HAMP domain-containing sensor histidine kinase [Planctomycetota bacterium]